MKLPIPSTDSLEAARVSARSRNASLYLVGGSVRDLLLGRNIHDFDLVTESNALELAATVAAQLNARLVSHNRFGTATVDTGQLRLDFSTARREVYPKPGALPQITPSNMEDDLRRRDFSINAMALCIAGPSEDSLLDPCGGYPDLQGGVIRVLHSGSFIDDPTRIFRAIRYEQRLGFTIDTGTLSLLKDALTGHALGTVSGDRIRRELQLILDEERPLPALHRARQLGLLQALHPYLGQGLPSTSEPLRPTPSYGTPSPHHLPHVL